MGDYWNRARALDSAGGHAGYRLQGSFGGEPSDQPAVHRVRERVLPAPGILPLSRVQEEPRPDGGDGAPRDQSVQAPRGSFPAPEEDEYYWVDLIGCSLYTTADGEAALIGVVDEVFDNGAHAVLKVLRQQAGANGPEFVLTSKGKPAEMLVPFVRAHIHAVDLAARRIDSDWPADLL